ncbi:MAG: FKBP-type peptidyl-prolyl cis-trans isomerase [Planctomycetes bacterium]|nr:FKBP-type peptidyl-prolyl cis-trans isomerase [Planctomycetota bacterium]
MFRRLLAALTGRTSMKVPEFVLPAQPQTTASGLGYEVVTEGTGAKPGARDTVTVHYAGWLPDGTLFDASYSRGQTISFPLNGVIKGWTEGLQLMSVGSTYRFVIPPELGYGARGAPPVIGPNATLVFHVELVKVG